MTAADDVGWPDLFGLPEYFVTDVVTETIGRNVRVCCGVRRGGTIHWLYSVVMPVDMLLVAARRCTMAAEETFGRAELRERDGQRTH